MPRKKCGDRDYIVILLCALIFMQVVFFRLNTKHPVTKIFFCYLDSCETVFFSLSPFFLPCHNNNNNNGDGDEIWSRKKKTWTTSVPKMNSVAHKCANIHFSLLYLRNEGNNISQNNEQFYYCWYNDRYAFDLWRICSEHEFEFFRHVQCNAFCSLWLIGYKWIKSIFVVNQRLKSFSSNRMSCVILDTSKKPTKKTGEFSTRNKSLVSLVTAYYFQEVVYQLNYQNYK